MKPQTSITAAAVRACRIARLAMFCFSLIPVGVAVFSSPGAMGGTSANAVSVGNQIRGKELFEKRCGGCHSLDTDKEGPRLRGVYGRKAGSVSTFKYSDALRTAGHAWDEASLDRWLTNTESVVPDNDMDFRVPKAEERADIIAYLRVTSHP